MLSASLNKTFLSLFIPTPFCYFPSQFFYSPSFIKSFCSFNLSVWTWYQNTRISYFMHPIVVISLVSHIILSFIFLPTSCVSYFCVSVFMFFFYTCIQFSMSSHPFMFVVGLFCHSISQVSLLHFLMSPMLSVVLIKTKKVKIWIETNKV